jgi:hypothetical protein
MPAQAQALALLQALSLGSSCCWLLLWLLPVQRLWLQLRSAAALAGLAEQS